MFDIQQFRSQGLPQGIQKPNLFLVSFTFNNEMLNGIDDPSERMMFLCEATQLPGVAFLSDNTVRRYGYGPTEKRPVLPIFDDLQMNFIGDAEGITLKFFHTWMNFISSFDTSQSLQSSAQSSSMSSSMKPYEMRYKNEYIAQNVQIVLFDVSGREIIEVDLVHAFPIFVPQIPLFWGSNNAYMRIPVSISFRDWYSKSYTVNNNNPLNGAIGIFSEILGAVNTPGSFSNINQIINTTSNILSRIL